MHMPKVVDEREKRREIRGAARRVFSKRGLVGTGLTHVAAAAGISRANLYNYYPDQAALVRDLADELLAEEDALFLAALEEEGSPLERIERLAGVATDLFGRWAEAGTLLLQIWANEPRRVRPLLRTVREVLADLIREGQRQGEIHRRLAPEPAAAVVVALIDGVLLQFFIDPRAFSESEALRRTVIHSVRRTLSP
jgi:AcrR family transcriptional regulator